MVEGEQRSLIAQDRFFDSNGVRIRYVEQGEEAPVIPIHGNGSSLNTWIDAGVLLDLAKDNRIIALDARRHGRSGKRHEAVAYGPEMGLDVIRPIGELGAVISGAAGLDL